MKDQQAPATGLQQRIPFVSAFLHWWAMPIIVYLRSSFGYSFLSPKSVFLAFVWAQILFTIFALLEPGMWPEFKAIATFGSGAAILYVIHLLMAVARETAHSGKHDFYSGTSHIVRLCRISLSTETESVRTGIAFMLEPSLIIIAACIFRGAYSETYLSLWLLTMGLALWLKEFINYWYRLRLRKKELQIYSDAEEKMKKHDADDLPPPSAGGRKPKTFRPPNAL